MPEIAPTPDVTLAPRALLIDPDTLLRKSWEKALRAEGFAVTGTPDADAGLILTSSFKPDIVVLDLRLRPAGMHRAGYFAEIRGLTDAYLIGVTDQSDELERVRLLRAGVEAAMVPNPFRTTLRVAGGGEYVLRLRTGGWIEGVQAVGLGAAENYTIEGNGRKLEVHLRPKPGQPREVSFGIRPMGAPVFLEGRRDGRPLTPEMVWIAREGVHPPEVPLKLPELEPVDEDKDRLLVDMLNPPPADRAGVQVWLQMAGGRTAPTNMSKERCESFKALGYLGASFDCSNLK